MSEQITLPEVPKQLVEKYEFHRQGYLADRFNEAQLRLNFVDHLFRALGWDVNNDSGYSEAYKEVLIEEPIKIGATTLFIDYTFRIGGIRKFIVETKKPSVRIKDDAKSALQVRRYAWNAKLPLNILTNFEEFAVYDCTIKPQHDDNAATARIEYFTWQDLPKKWEWLASIFTKESILRGSFDKYTKETKGKRGTANVDDTILAEIEEWRDVLAKNIALRNSALSVDELNDAVQKTIDRILFLRICEDRGIEPYGCLQKLLEGDDTYHRLCDLFRRADERYNSGLFHFNDEKDNDEIPDRFTLDLTIDDKVLKGILKRLYYPESPFEFSVIPPVILGHVYEQFLGKVIRLTEGHQAKVEYKPEVKKAGGVFYTPQYIVDYIVKQTVGELVKEKSPREVAKLRILDPACGSGSFLLGAYQYLLNWHRDWYIANLVPVIKEKSTTSPEVKSLLPEPSPKNGKAKKQVYDLPIYQAGNGGDQRVRSDWKLTTAERKRILLNNIYGVDIDRQAVEVTKLSLLLKVLEEESQETVAKQLTLFQERALPSLHKNIKCGNSLIGTDIYQDVQVTLDNPDVVKRINAFDWDREFAEIMQGGGFDAVIGNPPYVRQELLKEQKEYLKIHYKVYQGTADLYSYFIEKGIYLLRKSGIFAYIVSNKWMRASYGKPLRQFLKGYRINGIIDFGDLGVFQNATTYPCILIISHNPSKSSIPVVLVDSLSFPDLGDYANIHQHDVLINNLDDEGWSLINRSSMEILKNANSRSISLKEYLKGSIYSGIKTGLDTAFVIDSDTKNFLIQEDPKNQDIIKPYLAGRDIKRYGNFPSGKYLLFIPWHFPIHHDPLIVGASKKAENEFKVKYPSIYNHLLKFKDQLSNRNPTETGIRYEWYALQRYGSAYYQEFEKPKIMYVKFQVKPSFTIDYGVHYPNTAIFSIGVSDMYLLGILNSKIGWFLISNYCTRIQNGYQLMFQHFGKIPIRTIDFSDPSDKARHDQVAALVEQMLDFHKRLPEAKLDHDRTLIQRQIEATDKQIDELVYELYGLTEEERKIVEEGAK